MNKMRCEFNIRKFRSYKNILLYVYMKEMPLKCPTALGDEFTGNFYFIF